MLGNMLNEFGNFDTQIWLHLLDAIKSGEENLKKIMILMHQLS